MTTEIITCVGKQDSDWDHDRLSCYKKDCVFCTSHKGGHYTEDWIKCDCPVFVKKGERLQLKETNKEYSVKNLGKKQNVR